MDLSQIPLDAILGVACFLAGLFLPSPYRAICRKLSNLFSQK